MISNYINLTVNNKKIKIREVSFYEFKNICKNIITNDLNDLNSLFENILTNVLLTEKVNCIEKFYILIFLRNLIHGNDFSFTYDGIKVNTSLSSFLNDFDFNQEDIKIEHDNIIYHFNLPNYFFNPSIDKLLADCLYKINYNGKEINLIDISVDQKLTILSNLTLPIFDTYNKLKESFDEKQFTFFKNINLNIYDGSLLLFLKNIYYDDLNNLYNFEYTCVKNLNFGAVDMEKYTYPELKIFLQLLTKEIKDRQKDNNTKAVE